MINKALIFFHSPYLRGLAVTEEGTVYAAVNGCRCVVKITPKGKVETVLKSERPWSPTGVAVGGKHVFVLEYSNTDKANGWAPRIRKLGADGEVAILATISTAMSAVREGIIMRRTVIAAITAVVAAGSLPATADTVRFTGCPVRAVEGCLIVRNGPIVYNISSAVPSPRVGRRAIAVKAEYTGGIGLCFAKPLTNIRWHYIRHSKCP